MVSCKKMFVPKDVCYIFFSDKQMRCHNSICDELYTVRGEQVIIDLDKKGKVIGVELIGSKKARKPCQEGGKR
jgi:uncharacterized protein YuzE